MANAVRVRVAARGHGDDRDKEFRQMLSRFRRECAESGVLQSLREHESYESPSCKRRRKRREAELSRLKSKLRSNFGVRKK